MHFCVVYYFHLQYKRETSLKFQVDEKYKMGSYIQNHVFKICFKISWNYKNRDFRCKKPDPIHDLWFLTSKFTTFCGPAFNWCSQYFKNVILDVRTQKSCIGSGFLHLKSRFLDFVAIARVSRGTRMAFSTTKYSVCTVVWPI